MNIFNLIDRMMPKAMKIPNVWIFMLNSMKYYITYIHIQLFRVFVILLHDAQMK